MRAINIVGFKNSGKTGLMLDLAAALEAQGCSVAMVKHSHHDLDAPGSDTGRFRSAHSKRTVLALSEGESALFWGEKKELTDVLPLLNVDIILIEGGKKRDFLPRILCLRPEDTTENKDDAAQDLIPSLALATYSIQTLPQHKNLPNKPHFTGNSAENIENLAKLIQQKAFALPRLHCGGCGEKSCAHMARALVAEEKKLKDCPVLQGQAQLHVNGRFIPLNPFVARIMVGSLQGMVSELKGVPVDTTQKNAFTFTCTL